MCDIISLQSYWRFYKMFTTKKEQQVVEKKERTYCGKRAFFVGKGRDGLFYYLSEPTWDCGWYWGCGYLMGFSQNKVKESNMHVHTHIDSTLFMKHEDAYDAYKDFFETTTLTDDELWKFLDYCSSMYKLKDMSSLMHLGYSNYTSRVDCKIKSIPIYDQINDEMLPSIFTEMYKLLSPSGEQIKFSRK